MHSAQPLLLELERALRPAPFLARALACAAMALGRRTLLGGGGGAGLAAYRLGDSCGTLVVAVNAHPTAALRLEVTAMPTAEAVVARAGGRGGAAGASFAVDVVAPRTVQLVQAMTQRARAAGEPSWGACALGSTALSMSMPPPQQHGASSAPPAEAGTLHAPFHFAAAAP